MNTADLIKARFGVAATEVENPLIVAAGAVALLLLPNNPRRLAIVIVNLSANVEYIGLTAAVGAANGIYIAANGGTVSMCVEDDFTLVTRAWWIIAPAGASAVYSLSEEIYG